MISLIVARAENNVIGSKNDLPWYLTADLKHFKELTTSQTVVMGRKTLQSIINRLGHPLPNRRNIVITRQNDFVCDGVEVLHEVSDIEKLEGEVFIIGGAEIYAQTIDIADELYVTEVKANIDGDAYFPAIDPGVWREVARESHAKDDRNQYDFDFVVFERIWDYPNLS